MLMMNSRPIRDNILSDLGAEGHLLAAKCEKCGQVYYPPTVEFCMQCLHEELAEIQLSGEGSIHSYARSEVDAEFIKAPYVCGVIDMAEGVKVFAPMHPEHMNHPVSINMPVKVIVGEVWRSDNESVVGYHFIPA